MVTLDNWAILFWPRAFTWLQCLRCNVLFGKRRNRVCIVDFLFFSDCVNRNVIALMMMLMMLVNCCFLTAFRQFPDYPLSRISGDENWHTKSKRQLYQSNEREEERTSAQFQQHNDFQFRCFFCQLMCIDIVGVVVFALVSIPKDAIDENIVMLSYDAQND